MPEKREDCSWRLECETIVYTIGTSETFMIRKMAKDGGRVIVNVDLGVWFECQERAISIYDSYLFRENKWMNCFRIFLYFIL